MYCRVNVIVHLEPDHGPSGPWGFKATAGTLFPSPFFPSPPLIMEGAWGPIWNSVHFAFCRSLKFLQRIVTGTVRCAFSYWWLFICFQLVWLVAEWILWQNGWTHRDAAWQKFCKTANFLSRMFFPPGGPVPAPVGARALRLQPHQPHGWSGHVHTRGRTYHETEVTLSQLLVDFVQYSDVQRFTEPDDVRSQQATAACLLTPAHTQALGRKG